MSKKKTQKAPAKTEHKSRPTFELCIPPQEEGGDWSAIGALWPSKSGKAYSGKIKTAVPEGVQVVLVAVPAS